MRVLHSIPHLPPLMSSRTTISMPSIPICPSLALHLADISSKHTASLRTTTCNTDSSHQTHSKASTTLGPPDLSTIHIFNDHTLNPAEASLKLDIKHKANPKQEHNAKWEARKKPLNPIWELGSCRRKKLAHEQSRIVAVVVNKQF